MRQLKVLVGCESSGNVRDAFSRAGFYTMSCDLLPTEVPGNHYQGDIFDVIDDDWDLVIVHPPCTYLSVSGMHWTTRGLRDPKLTEDAIEFVGKLFACKAKHMALENPVSIISTRFRKPDQIIQPYNFGHDASKKTCLWLRELPLLKATQYVAPRVIDGKNRWANQCDSGQNKLGPSEDRWKKRSETYSGIADAMAQQWGDYIKWKNS